MANDKITPAVINKVRQVVRCFETGKVVGADYGSVTILPDGPKMSDGSRTRQITYGESQTTEFGNLPDLIQMYIEAGGKHAAELRDYTGRIGKLPSLYKDHKLLDILMDAGSDAIMHTTQDVFFDKYYMQPARRWFEANGFTQPLSLLVIYDSFVQSGSMLDFLRNKFPAVPPVKGGDEKEYIKEYVNTRDEWLEESARKELRNSDYRTDTLIQLIRQDNWLLDQPVQVVNWKDNDEKGTFEVRARIA